MINLSTAGPIINLLMVNENESIFCGTLLTKKRLQTKAKLHKNVAASANSNPLASDFRLICDITKSISFFYRANFKSLGLFLLITHFWTRQDHFDAFSASFLRKSAKNLKATSKKPFFRVFVLLYRQLT